MNDGTHLLSAHAQLAGPSDSSLIVGKPARDISLFVSSEGMESNFLSQIDVECTIVNSSSSAVTKVAKFAQNAALPGLFTLDGWVPTVVGEYTINATVTSISPCGSVSVSGSPLQVQCLR